MFISLLKPQVICMIKIYKDAVHCILNSNCHDFMGYCSNIEVLWQHLSQLPKRKFQHGKNAVIKNLTQDQKTISN